MKGLSLTGQMVIPWMEGRKPVTRRLMNPQPIQPTLEGRKMDSCLLETGEWGWYYDGEISGPFLKPRYYSGETVYIKETWRVASVNHAMSDGQFFTVQFKDFHVLPHPQPDQSFFDGLIKNDNLIPGETDIAFGRWRSPRFMPEWAARSHALIVSVRPEQIQSITDEEIAKEGIEITFHTGDIATAFIDLPGKRRHSTAQYCFQSLWESLHPGSWEKNDWVWRIELEKKS